ncbi:hypothetical protein [Patulibacter sp. SYSU D01012]|uniref:hypothetical protein n=1 Tax=Patulibacter sp. SYSU D01012 TaxID=2817381 RepID=UPI001B30E956|nr:hypothetical protein [Patulibacter sp. SYSU D01012]
MADERPTTPDDAPGTPDEEPTRVVPAAPPAGGSAAGTPPAPGPADDDAAGIEDIDVPAGGRVTEDTTAAPGGGPDAAAVTGGAPRATGPVAADPGPTNPGAAGVGGGTEAAGPGRGTRAKERTAEGAKIAADRVSQAASATARALRETDVREIAHSTTDIIQTTRPFFLAAFAAVFAFLGAVENHASIGVVFAAGAILCVLAAAFSSDLGGLVARRRDRRR